MKSITFSNLKKNINTLFDEVSDSSEIIIVPRKNEKDAIVIISMSEYNSMIETQYLLSTNSNRNRLKESINQVEKGEFKSFNLEIEKKN